MKEIRNVKFNLIESSNPNYVEVVATYTCNGKTKHHYMFLTKQDNLSKKDYLKQARAQFNEDKVNNKLKGGNVLPRATRRGGIIALASLLIASTLALGGLLTYRLLNNNPENTPEIITYKANAEIANKEESNNSYSLRLDKSEAKSNEDYKAKISLVKPGVEEAVEWHLPTEASGCSVKVNSSSLDSKNYTYSKSSSGDIADITIPSKNITGDVVISITLVRLDKPVVDTVSVSLDVDAKKVFAALPADKQTATVGKDYQVVLTAVVRFKTTTFQVYCGDGDKTTKIQFNLKRNTQSVSDYTLIIEGKYITGNIIIHADSGSIRPEVNYTITSNVSAITIYGDNVIGTSDTKITNIVTITLIVDGSTVIQSITIKRVNDGYTLQSGTDFALKKAMNQAAGTTTYELSIYPNVNTYSMVITDAILAAPVVHSGVAVNITGLPGYNTNLTCNGKSVTGEGIMLAEPIDGKITFQVKKTDTSIYLNSNYIYTDGLGDNPTITVTDDSTIYSQDPTAEFEVFSIVITVPDDVTEFEVYIRAVSVPGDDVPTVYILNSYKYFLFCDYASELTRPFCTITSTVNFPYIKYRNGYSASSNLGLRIVSGAVAENLHLSTGTDAIQINFSKMPTGKIYLEVLEPVGDENATIQLSSVAGTGTNDIYLCTSSGEKVEKPLLERGQYSTQRACYIKSDSVTDVRDWEFYIPGFETSVYEVYVAPTTSKNYLAKLLITVSNYSTWPGYNLTLAANRPVPTGLTATIATEAYDTSNIILTYGDQTIEPGTTCPIILNTDGYVEFGCSVEVKNKVLRSQSFNFGSSAPRFEYITSSATSSSGTLRVYAKESFTINSVTMLSYKKILPTIDAGSDKFTLCDGTGQSVTSSMAFIEGEPTLFQIKSSTVRNDDLGQDVPLYQLDLANSTVNLKINKTEDAVAEFTKSQTNPNCYEVRIPSNVDVSKITSIKFNLASIDAFTIKGSFHVYDKDHFTSILTQDGKVISGAEAFVTPEDEGILAPITSTTYAFYIKTDVKDLGKMESSGTYTVIIKTTDGEFEVASTNLTYFEDSNYNYKIEFTLTKPADEIDEVSINFYYDN